MVSLGACVSIAPRERWGNIISSDLKFSKAAIRGTATNP
jgi:hypothetical protein